MPTIHPRLRRERLTIEAVIHLYCRDRHTPPPGELCPDCQALQDYALQRLECCPFQEKKPTCANCAVHCYQSEMRARIREVMIYAGPRMLYHHPTLAVRHLLDGRRKPPALPRRKRADPERSNRNGLAAQNDQCSHLPHMPTCPFEHPIPL